MIENFTADFAKIVPVYNRYIMTLVILVLNTCLVNCKIESSYRSDHSMVILELEFIPFVCGKGLWKFNNSLLYDLEYSNIVKKKILEVKKQYGANAEENTVTI